MSGLIEIAGVQQKIAELRQQKAEIDREIERLGKTIRGELQKAAESFGYKVSLTLISNDKTSTGSVRRTQPKVKYRDNQGNTWTGRGIAPRWLQEAEKRGQTRDQFLVLQV